VALPTNVPHESALALLVNPPMPASAMATAAVFEIKILRIESLQMFRPANCQGGRKMARARSEPVENP
jgi:hypothetical protein